MMDLQDAYAWAYIFIAHDLALSSISATACGDVSWQDRRAHRQKVAVHESLHPYTQALLARGAVPRPKAAKRQLILAGDVPSPTSPPPGADSIHAVPMSRTCADAFEPSSRKCDPATRSPAICTSRRTT